MNLIPWKNKKERTNGDTPLETAMTRFRGEMDNLFERFFYDPWGSSPVSAWSGWGPQIDVAESDTEVTVKAELPGVDPKDLDIHVSGNTLTIRGEKKKECEEKGRGFFYAERRYGSFHRAIELPSAVDAEKVSAEFKNGVLSVSLLKDPAERPKKIKVRSE